MAEPTPDHPYKAVHVLADDGSRCLYCDRPRSAHPASPPEPVPESEEPPKTLGREVRACGCVYYYAGSGCIGAGFVQEKVCELHQEIATLRGQRDHYKRRVECLEPRPDPAPEPVDVAKAVVEWLDQNVSKCQHGYITVSCGECMGRYLK